MECGLQSAPKLNYTLGQLGQPRLNDLKARKLDNPLRFAKFRLDEVRSSTNLAQPFWGKIASGKIDNRIYENLVTLPIWED